MRTRLALRVDPRLPPPFTLRLAEVMIASIVLVSLNVGMEPPPKRPKIAVAFGRRQFCVEEVQRALKSLEFTAVFEKELDVTRSKGSVITAAAAAPAKTRLRIILLLPYCLRTLP